MYGVLKNEVLLPAVIKLVVPFAKEVEYAVGVYVYLFAINEVIRSVYKLDCNIT